MSSEKPDNNEKQKAPFTVMAKITTYSESGKPQVMDQELEADTLRELKSRMNGVEALNIKLSKELGKKITVTFGATMQLNPETNEYAPLQKETRGLMSRALKSIPPIFPSATTEGE
jgi:hypothetical protein